MFTLNRFEALHNFSFQLFFTFINLNLISLIPHFFLDHYQRQQWKDQATQTWNVFLSSSPIICNKNVSVFIISITSFFSIKNKERMYGGVHKWRLIFYGLRGWGQKVCETSIQNFRDFYVTLMSKRLKYKYLMHVIDE